MGSLANVVFYIFSSSRLTSFSAIDVRIFTCTHTIHCGWFIHLNYLWNGIETCKSHLLYTFGSFPLRFSHYRSAKVPRDLTRYNYTRLYVYTNLSIPSFSLSPSTSPFLIHGWGYYHLFQLKTKIKHYLNNWIRFIGHNMFFRGIQSPCTHEFENVSFLRT